MIDQEKVSALAEEAGFPRVSLFMPTHKGGPELRQEPIRLKNLLRRAEGDLAAGGLDSGEIDALLADARSHCDDETDAFWQFQDHGLAIFISPERTRYVRVPLELGEAVKVGRRFLVKPLLPLLARDGSFHLLSASQDGVALYAASRFSMAPVQDERLEQSLSRFLETTEISNAVGFHAANRGAADLRFHGLGESPKDEMQAQVEQYARAVAKAVDEILAGSQAPLVIAADDRLLGMLRKALSYRHVVEQGIREHPASLSGEALHERAYALVRDSLDQDRRDAMERFEARSQNGGAKVGSRIEDVVPAAVEGRVEALIVAVEASAEGVFDAEQNRAFVAPPSGSDGSGARGDHSIDLVDYAVLQTLAHGGSVFSRPADRSADFPDLGAVYRY